MHFEVLLDLTAELGYELAMCGAETFRVEESVTRILAAYGIQSEVFAITNCIIINIQTPDGIPLTRMKRIGFHGNDLDSVEKYSNLSRRICSEKPDPEIAKQWLNDTKKSRVRYKLPVWLLGNVLVAAGFAFFFGGTFMDSACAAFCGLLVGLTDYFLGKFKTNQFFKTILCAFIMTFAANITGILQIADNTDAVIIGTLMLLVPGLLFTNAMRDIIFGDTNSGINRIVQVLLVAAAIALGTGAAWKLTDILQAIPVNPPAVSYHWLLQCAACLVGCCGFAYVFNIHGRGFILCILGGALTWAAYSLSGYLGCGILMSNFNAAVFAAIYAEIMARIRKYPALSYLVTSLLPLVPGAGVYYAANHLVLGNMSGFAEKCTQTVAITGMIAVGILIVSTIVRLINEWKQHKNIKRASV